LWRISKPQPARQHIHFTRDVLRAGEGADKVFQRIYDRAI
jgi:hypothetical protein